MTKNCPNCGYDLSKKKVKLTLLIDETILTKAKGCIANLSAYTESKFEQEIHKLQRERDRSRG